MSDIWEIRCACGGGPLDVPHTREEWQSLWNENPGCDVLAYQCPRCGVRWLLAVHVPDLRD